MNRAVYVHIGAPKTGTTYLQDRLRLNQDSLAQHGVTIPAPRGTPSDLFHFRAALDVLERDWGGEPGHAHGAWGRLVRTIARGGGSAIVSHEILAPAPSKAIRRVVADLDGDVRIVYSARDLGRQLPAAWQESIKQGRRWTYASFLDKFARGDTWFYRAMDLPSVLSAWGAHVPADRITVVTVPHDRGPTGDLLWQRFCTAFGLDPAWLPVDSDRSNVSLGAAETMILRRLNKQLGLPLWRDPIYDELLRELLAQRVLAKRQKEPVRLPPDRYDLAEAESRRWIDWLEQSGVRVVGDPEDLGPRPPDPARTWQDPDKVPPREQLAAALDAMVALTREAAARREAADSGRINRLARGFRRS